MAFRDFGFPEVQQLLGLTLREAALFCAVPALSALRRILPGCFSLSSGVESDLDSARGLNSFCDFILSPSPLQSVLTAPVITIVEAKYDNLRTGLGPCIAAMVAARDFNAKSATETGPVHGVVTTGIAWKFLRLEGDVVTLDLSEYFIAELARIMGILAQLLGNRP
jgi:phospholipid N-methyltransferase